MEEDEEGVVVDQCSNCRFYHSEDYEEDDISYERTYGLCRRNPSKRIDGTMSGFPVVEDDCWCGEYQKNFVSNDK